MKKIGIWLDTPITWRSSLKVSAISMAIYAICMAIYFTYIFWDRILDKLDNLTALVKSKLNHN